MLRLTIALLFAVAVFEPAMSAEQALAHREWHRRAVSLPPGLPRPHYRFRTTISYGAPYPRLSVYENPRLLYAPDYDEVPYIRPWIVVPLVPNPNYGPYIGYWDRLPYACGIYGYC
jgi:hypothetical protein